MSRINTFKLFMISIALLPATAWSATGVSDAEIKEVLSMSLAELTNVKVTSVSKKAEPEYEAPAAIFVITQEDIRRSGATTIPETLRMAPGIVVTQSGSNNWTVSARGFNDQFSNKLLVLIDGRTIYSPLFSGVVWDAQDTMLEDIERIEVIRGPGATLWGANAVNGVINIITKNSKDTQGGLATAEYGNQVGIASVRYGVKVGNDSYIRTYAKYNDYASQRYTDGTDANDSWRKQQAGFRSDLKISDSGKLKIQGDIYASDEDYSYIFPDLASPTYYNSSKGFKLGGGNILMRWEEKLSSISETSLQAYFDNASQKTSFFNDIANTVDIEFQHVWTGWERQELIWGAGYRFINDKNDPSAQYALTPSTRNDSIYNAFLQDKFTLIPESVFLTLGSKFEHNEYSGFEVQPSARISWLPDHTQTVWASVSRAVHTPSRFDSDGRLLYLIDPPTISIPLPVLYTAAPNKKADAEDLIAYELGYRIQPVKSLSIDVTTFYNRYNNLLQDVVGDPTIFVDYISQPITVENINKAHSFGFESSVKYNVSPSWQLAGTYSYIDLKFDDKAQVGLFFVGKHPKNMFNLRSTYLFPNRVEMTNSLYTMSELSSINVPGYYRFDTKLSYPVTDSISVSLVGQNLLDERHKEFTPFLYQRQAEIGRSVYAGVSFKF